LGGVSEFTDFEESISLMASVCRALQEQNKLDYHESDSNSIRANHAITQFLTETNVLSDSNYTYLFPSYEYNFDDFLGANDWANTFVNRLMETRKGNCHSMPYLYKMLADELGASAYLSLAPNHIYLRHRCKTQNLNWFNTELTNRSHPTDAWLMASGYITIEAIQNGIYMDNLTEQGNLALCLIDLAHGFAKKYPNKTTTDFQMKCVDLALKHQPNFINALLLKAELLAQLVQNCTDVVLQRLNAQILNELCAKIHQLGYRRMPEKMYANWLSGKGEEAKPYANSEQQKRHRQGKPLLTLSNGQFAEIHTEKDKVQIGNAIFDTKVGEVVGFVEEDSVSESLAGRFLSIDPLASKYPDIAPYAFVMNNPIRYLDPDGRIVVDANGNIIATKKGDDERAGYREVAESGQIVNGKLQVIELVASFDILNIYTDAGNAIRVERFNGYKRRISLYDTETGKLNDSYTATLKEGDMSIIREVDENNSSIATNCHGLSVGRGMVRIDPSEMKKIINDEFSNIANTDGSHIIFVEWQDGNDEYDSHSFVPLNDGNSFIYNDGDQPTRQTKSIKEALGKKGNKEGSKISYMKKNQPNRINSAVSPINQKNGVRVLEGEEKDKFEKSLEKQ
jgi:hypothetical protein